MQNNFRTNTVIMLLYQISMYLIPLITIPYVSRILGPEGVGVFSYTSAIMSFCIVLTTMGVAIYGKREIASCLDESTRNITFWSIFSIETMMLLVTATGYIIYIYISNTPYRVAAWLQLLALLGAWLDISWLFFGVENFKIAILRNILIRLITLIAIFIFVKESTHTNRYVAIVAFSDLVSVVPLWLMLKKYVTAVNINVSDIKKRIIPMLKMLVTAVSLNLFIIADKIILAAYETISMVGIYDNAFRISKVTVSIITTIGIVMLPRMTKMFAEGSSKSFDYFCRSLSLTMFVGAGCCFGLIAVAPTFIPLYLGADFYDSIYITQILAVVLLFIAWGNVFRSQYILPQKMDSVYVKSILYAVCTNLVLNILLIPKFSIYGAAIAYIATEGTMAIYQSYKVKSAFNMRLLLRTNLIYILSGIVMFLVVYILGNILSGKTSMILLLTIQLLVGSLIYISISCYMELKIKNEVIWTELLRLSNNIISKHGKQYN